MSIRLAPRAAKSIISALACMAVFAAPTVTVAQKSPSPNLIPLRVAVTPDVEGAALVYASQRGLFQKAGLDVRIDRQVSGSAGVAALLGGSYDVVDISVTALFTAHAKGLPLTIIAPTVMYDSRAPFTQLIVAKDSAITEAKDLNGKTVGVAALSGIGRVALDSWMEKKGGDPQSVHFLEVPFSVAQAALEQHRIDAFAGLLEPHLSKALASGKMRAFPDFAAAIAPSFLYTAQVANSDWARTHPQVVKAFRRVMAQSAAYLNANPAAADAMLADFTGLSVEAIQHMIRPIFGTTLNASELRPTIDAAVRDGVIKHAFPASELIDSDVIEK